MKVARGTTLYQLMILAIWTRPAAGCACMLTATPCEVMQDASVVVLGTVVNSSVSGWLDHSNGRPATLRVESIIRGLPKNTTEIQIDPSTLTDCYLPLKAGERWVVMGHETTPGTVATRQCSGSYVVGAEDRWTEVRIRSNTDGPNLVFGNIRREAGVLTPILKDNLMQGVPVKLFGNQGSWEGRTDSQGEFVARELPPGEYSVQVVVPGLSAEIMQHRVGGEVTKIKVAERGCVELNAVMWPDQNIRGRVVEANGSPAVGLTVVAYTLEGPRQGKLEWRRAVTDSAGNYVLPRMRDGTYVIGVGTDEGIVDRSWLRFYPSNDEKSAQGIHLTGSGAGGIDLRLQ